MARIEWDQTGQRFYEAGVDRGVLYLPSGSGVPWNGLVSVRETLDGDGSTPLHIDGVKYFDDQEIGDYLATVQAFTYPDEMLELEGQEALGYGIFAGEQMPKTFNMSYRTGVGNDVDPELGYQIHLLYNVTAMPQMKMHQSLSRYVEPSLFSWQIAAVPSTIPNYRPTAHVYFDTRYMHPYMLEDFEDMLYGTSEADPYLPPLDELLTEALEWAIIKIVDNGDGTWTAISPDKADRIQQIDETTFEIVDANVEIIDSTTYIISDSQI